ncbi:branched-chain amino acid ABC transporter substrate-binding protein [Herbaspirillum sp. SJZ099]|nr:branched-chain amino acid ABC transporter substrate-binding protein [Herbaspirillum sp. SJZ099]
MSAAIAPATHAQADTQVALIGLAMPLSTPRGQALRDAALQGIEDANKRNIVVDGKKIVFKLFEVDDKNDNNHAALGAQTMVNAQVIGVVGHLSTDASLIGARIYNKAGIPLVSPTATARAFTQQGYANVFQLLGHTEITTDHLVRVATQTIGAKRIMVVDNDTELGYSLANSFTRKLREKGLQVVARASVNQKTSDFNGVLSQAQQAGADMIFLAAIVPQAMAFAQRLQQRDPALTLLLAGGAVNYNFPGSSDEYGSNTWIVVHGLPEEKLRGFKALKAAYSAKFKTNLIPQSLFTYDCVGVLAEAVRQSNSLDPAKLITALHRLHYAGVSGPVSFDAEGSLREPNYSLYRVEQDHWTAVQTFP